ncbi:MAG: MBOAT family protein [Peptococcaceae bacterium]|nr:MBOAT family protein [Peptococcaceae bacterium]
MLFSSVIFLFAFLPLCLITYYLTPRPLKNGVLLLFSLFFYAWGEPRYVFLMIFSILVNYFLGVILGRHRNKGLLSVAVAFNLLVLIFFKYFGFLVATFAGITHLALDLPDVVSDIALPIGISFYTFQILSYIVDVYRGKAPVQNNILSLGLYISLFPPLIAGPIVRYNDIAHQIVSRTADPDKIVAGIKRFIVGLSKKILLANVFAQTADLVFDSSYATLSTPLAWLGIVCYTLQIYFDFSGYSDMAIGLARMFGFDIPENFNYPYISRSVQEFWRRWHISLSSWFRDYVYIPLGGNRKGNARVLVNLTLVFFLCGLWHGASWSFVVWGLYHGMFLVAERLFLKDVLAKTPFFLRHIYLVVVVMVGWVFFRVAQIGDAATFLHIMFTPHTGNGTLPLTTLVVTPHLVTVLLAGILASTPVLGTIKKHAGERPVLKTLLGTFRFVALVILFVMCLASLASDSYNPFIYFRF